MRPPKTAVTLDDDNARPPADPGAELADAERCLRRDCELVHSLDHSCASMLDARFVKSCAVWQGLR
jgi:hypothetical protein